MFRKTFIRLILSTVVASAALIAYSSSRSVNSTEKETCEAKECTLKAPKGEMILLETLTRTLFSQASK